ncbi:MAG: hypothetical protein EP338_14050 [Bacteroidetes bacterium]|nr:MAG: hypothetical protein EP338_14050 [Bacteroidota bacterium]
MNKTTFFVLLLGAFSLVACKSDPDPDFDHTTDHGNSGAHGTKHGELGKKDQDSSSIEVLFTDQEFKHKTERQLLIELGMGMCNPNETDEENYKLPPCSPKFFKLFPYQQNKELEDAFVLLVKSRVHDFPLRRVFVFQRVDGKLVKVNGFVANLIGNRKAKGNHNDLVLRFSDEDQNHFNCRYSWRNEHYEFAEVEQINDANIKAVYQDSMNLEIEELILRNRMQF